jgi:hypothetical protein
MELNAMCKVYYWKSLKWLTELTFAKNEEVLRLLPTKEQFENQWVLVATFEGEQNPEYVFMEMNANPAKHFRAMAYSEGIGHTSMSIGDIIEQGGKHYIATATEFIALPY